MDLLGENNDFFVSLMEEIKFFFISCDREPFEPNFVVGLVIQERECGLG